MKTTAIILLLLLCTTGCGRRETTGEITGTPEPVESEVVFTGIVESTGLVVNLRERTPMISIGAPGFGNFTLTVKIECIESASGKPVDMLEEGRTVIFAINSPVIMFMGEPNAFIGESCKFTFIRTRLDDGRKINVLNLDEGSAKEILNKKHENTGTEQTP